MFKSYSVVAAVALLTAGALASEANETARWQAAIDAAAAQGGGRVTVPAGRHLVGQLDLRSNVEIHLAEGAVLEGVPGMENYRVLTLPYSEGTWSAVLSAVGVTNVAVTGKGEVYGNGTAWPQPKDYGGNQEGLRPRGLFFADVKGIRLEDFRLRDAACWGIVFKCCDGVVARRVTIDSHANANNDGFDIEARNVLIEDCDVCCGDDSYCVKSNNPKFVVENILVRNCVGRSHCNVFKLGTASHGTMRNIRFEHCRSANPRRDFIDRRPGKAGRNWYSRHVLPDYPNGLGTSAIVVECVDGGIVENVVYEDIEIAGQWAPIFVRGGTRKGRSCGTPPSDWHVLRNITISNVRGSCEGDVASSVSGVEGCAAKNVVLKDIAIECRGADALRSEKARTAKVVSRPGGYPEATQSFGRDALLPAFGLYAEMTEGLKLDNVNFALRAGAEDKRRPIVLATSAK